MKTSMLRSLSLLALATAALSSRAQTAFYGGDFDGNPSSGVSTYRNARGYGTVYDDFTLGETTVVKNVFGNFLATSPTLYYEIRQGVTSGNGGTLLFSGTVTSTSVANGTTQAAGTSFDIFKVKGAVSGVTLGAGTYFLGLSAENAYLVTASGANGVGGPLDNGVSYFNSAFAFSFVPTSDLSFRGGTDFSMGLNEADAAPSVPGPLAALPFALMALKRRCNGRK